MSVFNKTKLKALPSRQAKAGLIMLVDDEPANILALSGVLSERFELITANDGMEALEKIKALPNPDELRLVISDQRMPRMTGTELFEKLITLVPKAVRIILTGYSDMQAITDAINKSQIYRYICKPFDRNDMIVTVDSAIEAFEMREARAIAEAKSKATSDFLATVSHEIRTPLNGMMGMLRLLERTPLNNAQHELLSSAHACASNLMSLINDLLDVSKVEAGQMTIETVPFDLSSLVKDVFDNQNVNAESKGVLLVEDYAPALPRGFMGDPVRIKQVIMNLVGNAIKFTSQGHVMLQVAIAPAIDGKHEITLDVIDTGIGIPKDKLERIFERFGQADASTTRQYGGTGLGLSISKQLLALMGGSLVVSSKPGVGSTFSARLTLAGAVLPEGNEPVANALPDKRILVAVGNEMLRSILSRTLTEAQAHVDLAESGDEAIDKVISCHESSTPYDCVLYDKRMRDIDHETFASVIKSDPRFAACRLILLGSSVLLAQTSQLQRMGFDGLLAGTVHCDELLDVTNRVFQAGDAFVTRSRTRAGGTPLEMHFPGSRLLVVDDNAVNRDVAKGMLSLVGCHCVVASGGAQALELLEREHFDLVLLDCQMPEMDGYETVARIRRKEVAGQRIPVIALTANALEGDRQRCLSAGMDDYLTKPILPEAIQEKLKVWLKSFACQAEKVSTPTVIASDLPGEIQNVASLLGDVFVPTVQKFLQGLANIQAELEQAIAEGNSDAVRNSAHAIAGSASSIGASELSSAVRKIEHTVIHAGLAGVTQDMIDHFRATSNQARDILETFLQKNA